ncbi:argininosuccinate lyase isoform X2 [Schistocerca serialis cubense]|uniref:argininosuccinate lyase isoform X2 n=1 Tax=Schistocerca serialis cubense TaxID=2023355 RepID=UPI00214F5D45|nr:argininosuccinate lyase isoform X2 [Schistocerca serialis cubense]
MDYVYLLRQGGYHKGHHPCQHIYYVTFIQLPETQEAAVHSLVKMEKQDVTVKLWGGRFSRPADPLLEKLNTSIDCDQKMWHEDIRGSMAYAEALKHAGLISADEEVQIKKGLQEICKEWQESRFTIKSSDEDIHTAIERRLKELIGEPASKLHTGRSRNDQVATDMKLWLLSHIQNLQQIFYELVETFTKKAQDNINVIMPGYTHLQRAQTIRWSHWLLSHTWSLISDYDRLCQLFESTSVMPLGSGALAGNPFEIDRKKLAKNLGFKKISQNSMHAVSDRDFVAEFLFWSTLTAIHLSRLAEDLIIYSSEEFAFVKLSDAYATGSSLMPQKKNPDSLELIRGKSGCIFGHFSGFMMVLKGLPSTYNKDLQEDKRAMFETYNNMEMILKITKGIVETMEVNKEVCLSALTPNLLATDVAYYLVRKGVPFREAHHIVGEVVATAEKQKKQITDLTVNELQLISSKFSDDIKKIWDYTNSVEQYRSTGGTCSDSILLQIRTLKEWVEKEKQQFSKMEMPVSSN